MFHQTNSMTCIILRFFNNCVLKHYYMLWLYLPRFFLRQYANYDVYIYIDIKNIFSKHTDIEILESRT
jgi:hypothetical protein